MGCDSGSDFNGGIVGVGGIVQWRIVGKDGIIVEVMEVVGVEGSRVLFERYLPLHDTVLKRYRVALTRPPPGGATIHMHHLYAAIQF